MESAALIKLGVYNATRSCLSALASNTGTCVQVKISQLWGVIAAYTEAEIFCSLPSIHISKAHDVILAKVWA